MIRTFSYMYRCRLIIFIVQYKPTLTVCSEDYKQWLVSMYSLFGTKFSKNGMWSNAEPGLNISS